MPAGGEGPGGGVTETDGSHNSGDFVTAQQTNSKLLQLLTSEYGSQTTDTPIEGMVKPSYLALGKEGRGQIYEEMQRPRSMPVRGQSGHSVMTKKSPLATTVSRAPQIDHTHNSDNRSPDKVTAVTIKEEPLSPVSSEPLPSAPPIDVLHAEIRKVNSYSGLGKRRSLFSQTPPTSKKVATAEKLPAPTKKPAEKIPVGVASGSQSSLSSGALNLAAKMLSQAKGHAGLLSSGMSAIGTMLGSPPTSAAKRRSLPGGAPPPAVVVGEGVASSRGQGLATPSGAQPSSPSSLSVRANPGRRRSLDSFPTGGKIPPARQQTSAPVRSSPATSSNPSRAKSWLEHLKSK